MNHAAVWQYSSNSNIKIVHNSIENFLWNPSDFSSGDVLSCLRIFFHKLCLSGTPSENNQVGWDLEKRMARGYQFDTKWVYPMVSYVWGIQVFCSRNEVAPHFSNRTLEYLKHNLPWCRLILRHLNTSGITYHGTD